MSVYKGLNYGGTEWTPQFVKEIDHEKVYRLWPLRESLLPRRTRVWPQR